MESELNAVTLERNDLREQLLNAERKKDALNEELRQLRYRIKQVGEANACVNKHLEELVKECEEKQVSTDIPHYKTLSLSRLMCGT